MFTNILVKKALITLFLVGACSTVAMQDDDLAKSLRDLELAMTALNAAIPSAQSQIKNGPETNLAEIENKYKSNFQENYYTFIIFIFNNIDKDISGPNFPKELVKNIIEIAYFLPLSISSPSREQLNSDVPAFDLKGLLGENELGNIYKMTGRVICNNEGFEFLQIKYREESKPIHGFFTTAFEPKTIVLFFLNEKPSLDNPSIPTGSLIPLNFKKCCIDLSKDYMEVIGITSVIQYDVYSAPKFENIKFLCYR